MLEEKIEQEELNETVNSTETEEGTEETTETIETPEEVIIEKTDEEKIADLNNKYVRLYSDFDRAIANNKKSEDLDGVKEGFKLIHNKFDNILKGKGLEVVDATGEVFNADVHEAITNIPAPKKSDIGKVIDCVEKGYNLKGKSIRYPKVVVGQ